MKPAPRIAVESTDRLEAPAVLERLVQGAMAAGASDLHLHLQGAIAEVALRIDGVLNPSTSLAADLAQRVIGRIKYLARLQTWQDTLPQDGRINGPDLGLPHDLRVATYPTVTGEKVVLRLFTDAGLRRLHELGLDPAARAALESFLRRPAGLLLLTGPAGSGKTTTIYAGLLELLELGGRHVITIEDPVEQRIPGVMQTEVCEARGLTFATAARHLLRQDPQVLVIGEIRDDDTAAIAVRSALTGHLVISTLHAGSCGGVLERLLVLCRDHSAVAAAVEVVWNQRLVRRPCGRCRGEGCADCAGTGYRGRRPIAEWVRVDGAAREALRHGRVLLPAAISLEAAARELVGQGLTDGAELRRVIGS